MIVLSEFMLITIELVQSVTDTNILENSSSNPGLVIGSAIIVAIIILGVIIHSRPLKGD